MKSLVLSTLLITSSLVALTSKAQTMKTLMGNGRSTSVTGHGGATGKITQFKGEMAVFSGGYGGITLNHKYFIGAGALGLATTHRAPEKGPDGKLARWNMRYGGFLFDYIYHPHKAIHVTVGTLLGGGALHKAESGPDRNSDGDIDGRSFDRSYLFAVEPQINVEANVFRWMRVAVGGSYRYIQGADSGGITDKDLSAPAANLMLKFGRF